MKYFLGALGLGLMITPAFASVEMGKIPAAVILDGDDGGNIAGGAWDSSTMKGKVHFFVYVDPDEKDTNTIMEDTLRKEDFPKENYQSVAIINMDATWLPNFAIASAIASKQEKFPEVLYAKDMKKVLVEKWGLKDDAYVVLIFDKQGQVVWESVGTLDQQKSDQMVATIKAHLND